jgi:hypothetical protein
MYSMSTYAGMIKTVGICEISSQVRGSPAGWHQATTETVNPGTQQQCSY